MCVVCSNLLNHEDGLRRRYSWVLWRQRHNMLVATATCTVCLQPTGYCATSLGAVCASCNSAGSWFVNIAYQLHSVWLLLLAA